MKDSKLAKGNIVLVTGLFGITTWWGTDKTPNHQIGGKLLDKPIKYGDKYAVIYGNREWEGIYLGESARWIGEMDGLKWISVPNSWRAERLQVVMVTPLDNGSRYFAPAPCLLAQIQLIERKEKGEK